MNTKCSTVVRMEHNEWLTDLIGADSIRHASQKVGFAATTITRQLQRGSLSPEMVISLCRAYDRSPVTGLIETGFLNAWETEGVSIPYALNQATNKQILDEIMDRSDPEATVLFGGGDDVIDVAPNAEVFHLPDTPRRFAGEQDETVESTPNVQDGGYDPLHHVAYSGPDEDRLRKEQEGDWEDPDHPIP